jgi:hypothetical protein
MVFAINLGVSSTKKGIPNVCTHKNSGKYQYLQVVENRKELGKVNQRVIATVGRMDYLHDKDRVETLIRSLSLLSEKALFILSGKSDVIANSLTIGPTLVFFDTTPARPRNKTLSSTRKYGG